MESVTKALCILAMICFGIESTATLQCKITKDCSSVTENPAFVNCVSDQCTCLTANGFIGNASTSYKCNCANKVYPSLKNGSFCKNCQKPSKIYYDENSIPRCVNLAQAEAYQEQVDYQERNKLVVKRVYDSIIDPMPQKIVNDLVANKPLPDMFAEDVRGRINPFGEFEGGKGIAEYFYGVPVASKTIVIKTHYIDLVAEKNEVFFRVDIEANQLSGLPRNGNLTHIGRFTFNEQSKVISFEFTNMNLGTLMDTWVSAVRKIQVICYVATNFCTGVNLQYKSNSDCVAYLQAVPEGTWYRGNSNTTTCRYLHSHLASIDPDHHCSHIGTTGGGKCIDFPYEYYYQNFF